MSELLVGVAIRFFVLAGRPSPFCGRTDERRACFRLNPPAKCAYRYPRGSCAMPSILTSKCKWSPKLCPVFPT